MTPVLDARDLLIALVLVRDIRAALQRGTQHYDSSGRRLLTVPEVLDVLRREGGVRLRMLAREEHEGTDLGHHGRH